jgi:peptidyl-prolyl cis-trans isomerase A (cyclophilin A)
MAHGADPNSGQSSFYFDLAANANLNAKPGAPANTTGFAVFGHVIEGMDVLDKISAVPLAPKGGPFPGKLPKTPIVVKKAVVVAGE